MMNQPARHEGEKKGAVQKVMYFLDSPQLGVYTPKYASRTRESSAISLADPFIVV